MRHIYRSAAIALTLLAASLPATAEPITMSYQAITHIRSAHSTPVLDVPSHTVGVAAFRGLAIFPKQQIAVHRYDGWFDIKEGSGKFHGYALWRFDDKSEIRAAYDGRARKLGGKGFAVEATIRDVTGTGRFAGITGDGEFKGRRVEPIDKGGSTYLEGTLTLMTPD